MGSLRQLPYLLFSCSDQLIIKTEMIMESMQLLLKCQNKIYTCLIFKGLN